MSLKATRDPQSLPSPAVSVHPTSRRIPGTPAPALPPPSLRSSCFLAFLSVPRDTWVLPRARGAPRGPAQGARERGGALAPGAGGRGWELEPVALRAAAEGRRRAGGPLGGRGRPSRPFEPRRVLPRRPQAPDVLRASANRLTAEVASVWAESSRSGHAAPPPRSRRPLV